MPAWKDNLFEKWWPLAQSLILVHAGIKETAKAMQSDAKRLHQLTGADHQFDWMKIASLDDLFRSVDTFTICPGIYYAIPTKSEWTVLWDNAFDCTPYDSFAHNLTHFQRQETICFSSTDRNSTQLAGTHFTFRQPIGRDEISERDVYCCNQGSRWHFEQHGEPLPEEDLSQYLAKRKRDRLNEENLMALLDRIGIHPWRESSYDFTQTCFRMSDTTGYPANRAFNFQQVRQRADCASPPEEDVELVGPPDYLQGRCRKAKFNGPARLLADGKWCGHGEEIFWIYDIETNGCSHFSIQLPEVGTPPVVMAMGDGNQEPFPIYDSRLHPASPFLRSTKESRLRMSEHCPKCNSDKFHVAVGFEVPIDAETSKDTSWFAVALECTRCGFAHIAYDDETA